MASRYPLTINTNTLTIEEIPANVQLNLANSSIANIPSIDFETTSGLTPTVGQMSWSSDFGTIDIGMNGNVIQHIGQQSYYFVQAQENLIKGRAIMFAGVTGGTLLAKHANTSDMGFQSQYVMGVAADNINSGDQGYVTAFGKIQDLDTSSYTNGAILWLSPNTEGIMTVTEPTAPNPKVIIAACLNASTPPATNGRILVRVTFEPKISDLENVSITSAAAGQALVFNGNIWVNGNVNLANSVIQNNQPNITSVGTLANLTVNGVSNLGPNSNVIITGGSNGQILSTNGSGNLSWTTVSTSSISNGNSNVNIPAVNGNVIVASNGTNIATFTSSSMVMGTSTQLSNVSISTPNDITTIGRRVVTGPGFDWTEVNTGINTSSILGVCYGGGLFVAVGQNTFLYSADGIRWNSGVSPQNSAWNEVIYGNGLFVAVSSNGTSRAAYSTNGINWTLITLPGAISTWEPTGVAFGNGRFVISTYGGNPTINNPVYVSLDGINWTDYYPGRGEWNTLVYGDGIFVNATFFSASIRTSTDGITWTNRTSPLSGFAFQNGAYGNGMFILTYDDAASYAYSTNGGVTWTAGTSPINTFQDIVYANGLWIIMSGSGGNYATSPDGINWTLRTGLPNRNWSAKLAYGNGRVINLVGGSPTYALYSGTLLTNDTQYGYNKFYGDWQFTSNVSAVNFNGRLANGTSNVNIPAVNGNVNISVGGNSNVFTVTSTGANITGTLNITGITTINGNANLKISGGSNGQVLSTDGSGNLSWASAGASTKEYLCAVKTNSTTVSSANTVWTFNSVSSNNGISYNTTSGNLTLTGGKVYRITTSPRLNINTSTTAVYNVKFNWVPGNDTTPLTTAGEGIIPTDYTSSGTHAFGAISDFIYAPANTGNIRLITIDSSNETSTFNGGTLVVVEI